MAQFLLIHLRIAAKLLPIAVGIHAIVTLSLLGSKVHVDTTVGLICMCVRGWHTYLITIVWRSWVIEVSHDAVVKRVNDLHLWHVNKLLVLESAHVRWSCIDKTTARHLVVLLNLLCTSTWATTVNMLVYLLLIIDVADHSGIHLRGLLILRISLLSHLNLSIYTDKAFAGNRREWSLVSISLHHVLYRHWSLAKIWLILIILFIFYELQ